MGRTTTTVVACLATYTAVAMAAPASLASRSADAVSARPPTLHVAGVRGAQNGTLNNHGQIAKKEGRCHTRSVGGGPIVEPRALAVPAGASRLRFTLHRSWKPRVRLTYEYGEPGNHSSVAKLPANVVKRGDAWEVDATLKMPAGEDADVYLELDRQAGCLTYFAAYNFRLSAAAS